MSISTLRAIEAPVLRPLAEQISQLQADARDLAADHVELLIRTLTDAARMSAEVADGGDLYPVGVRELAVRLAEDCGKRALTLTAIMDRR